MRFVNNRLLSLIFDLFLFVVCMQVGTRIIAKPSTKQYSILSVAFQLYATPTLNFKIPNTVFFPKPKV